MSETWVLNETAGDSGTGLSETTVNFTSNNLNFVALGANNMQVGPQSIWYYTSLDVNEYVEAKSYGTWNNEAYKTITFDEPVTDTKLLTWLQANGTKQ